MQDLKPGKKAKNYSYQYMAELDNNGLFKSWDSCGDRFESMILRQLEEDELTAQINSKRREISDTKTDYPTMSGVIFYDAFRGSKIITCSYCKSQHNTLYLNKHSYNQCSQCGAPLRQI